MDQFPAAPVTLDDLIVRWAQRDAEYAKQRTPMAPDMAASVRAARMKEASSLPDIKERAAAWARANAWVPPTHQEFGDLREWVQ